MTMDELNKYKKSNPFNVPENYFEGFEQKLSEKIDEIENKNTWTIKSLKPFLSIAAGFLLLFSLWLMFLNKLGNNKMASNEDLTEQEVIFGYFESVNSDELIQILSAEDFNDPDFAINLERDIDLIIDELDESIIIDEIEDLNTLDEPSMNF